jgi:hypothetical protein
MPRHTLARVHCSPTTLVAEQVPRDPAMPQQTMSLPMCDSVVWVWISPDLSDAVHTNVVGLGSGGTSQYKQAEQLSILAKSVGPTDCERTGKKSA